jgi:hypothetical protein
MPESEQLNSNAIMALGLKTSDFGLGGSKPETTGQAPAGGSNQSGSHDNNDTSKPANPGH